MEKLLRSITFVANGILKFLVANVAVLLIIVLLPVFLFTDNVSVMNQIIDYLFTSKS